MAGVARSVLAIDPGTRFAWAVGVWPAQPTVGVIDLRDVGPERGHRLWHLGRYLRGLIHEHQPAEICYEAVHRHLGVDAAHVYGGILAVILVEAWEAKVPTRGIGVNAAKKAAVPDILSRVARARVAKRADPQAHQPNSKVAVLQAVRAKYPGLQITGFDEADAVAIWLAAGEAVGAKVTLKRDLQEAL
jgi:Holliday junction resolvasome RuvABC endonuclease subunit